MPDYYNMKPSNLQVQRMKAVEERILIFLHTKGPTGNQATIRRGARVEVHTLTRALTSLVKQEYIYHDSHERWALTTKGQMMAEAAKSKRERTIR